MQKPRLGAWVAVVGLTGVPAEAQTNVQWVAFAPDNSHLGPGVAALTDTTTEVDFAVGDLDRDGWVDVVAVRKQPSSGPGARTAVLLMNEAGVLRDRTADYAASSDVAGIAGFLTATNDRDVEVADVTGDDWPDVITCLSLNDGAPKATSHPHVYRNLGDDAGGNWLGLLYEGARIPQLLTTGGLPVAPRFTDLSVADVDLDGDLDLHFVDHDDSGTTHPAEPVSHDLDDRLLINDGSGWFSDQSSSRLTATQVLSEFGVATSIADLNGDGAPDIARLTTDGTPQNVMIEYNEPGNLGHFQALGEQTAGSGAPYNFDVGELNGDGRIDLVIEDDSSDRYRINQGNDGLGKVIWGPLKTFAFVSGSDNEFGGNPYVRDLDADGWNDVLICDADVDSPACTRRLHIYHNLGGVVGGDVTIKEEAELANGAFGSGWKGVVGMTANEQKGTYDLALADFDNDGDIDMLCARCAGTSFWENQSDPPEGYCQTDLGHGGPGSVSLSICGDDLTQPSSVATLSIAGASPLAPVFLAVGLADHPTPFKGGTLVPVPILALLGPFPASGAGTLTLGVPGNGGAPLTLYLQAIAPSAPAFHFSNALRLVIGT